MLSNLERHKFVFLLALFFATRVAMFFSPPRAPIITYDYYLATTNKWLDHNLIQNKNRNKCLLLTRAHNHSLNLRCSSFVFARRHILSAAACACLFDSVCVCVSMVHAPRRRGFNGSASVCFCVCVSVRILLWGHTARPYAYGGSSGPMPAPYFCKHVKHIYI